MSRHYHTLESEKYYTGSLLTDHQLSRMKMRQTFKDCIVNCTLVIITAAAAFYAIKTMPFWLPEVQAWFHQITNYKYA